jgi:16S rRNA processing protein RimM
VAAGEIEPGEDWMLVGTVAAAHGVRGEVKVDLATDFPDRFKRLKTVYVGDEHRPMAVLGARRHGGRVALRLEGITDRDAAQSLRGAALSIPRAEAMPLPEGHYYYDQIIGLNAITTDGTSLGTVVEILSTGSNEVYVVRDEGRGVLIPAIRDVVREIDLAAGVLVVEPIEGLL